MNLELIITLALAGLTPLLCCKPLQPNGIMSEPLNKFYRENSTIRLYPNLLISARQNLRVLQMLTLLATLDLIQKNCQVCRLNHKYNHLWISDFTPGTRNLNTSTSNSKTPDISTFGNPSISNFNTSIFDTSTFDRTSNLGQRKHHPQGIYHLRQSCHPKQCSRHKEDFDDPNTQHRYCRQITKYR